MSDISTAEFEVIDAPNGGWSVRRAGEAEVLSRHDSREQAEKAARLHSSAGVGVDLRQDIFTNDPESAVRPKHTRLAAALALLVVIALLVVLGLIVA